MEADSLKTQKEVEEVVDEEEATEELECGKHGVVQGYCFDGAADGAEVHGCKNKEGMMGVDGAAEEDERREEVVLELEGAAASAPAVAELDEVFQLSADQQRSTAVHSEDDGGLASDAVFQRFLDESLSYEELQRWAFGID